MPAEWGDCRQAYDCPDAVSGKHRAVYFRWACNNRFRKAVTAFADNSQHASPWAAKI